jgi:hypothetical protein
MYTVRLCKNKNSHWILAHPALNMLNIGKHNDEKISRWREKSNFYLKNTSLYLKKWVLYRPCSSTPALILLLDTLPPNCQGQQPSKCLHKNINLSCVYRRKLCCTTRFTRLNWIVCVVCMWLSYQQRDYCNYNSSVWAKYLDWHPDGVM